MWWKTTTDKKVEPNSENSCKYTSKKSNHVIISLLFQIQNQSSTLQLFRLYSCFPITKPQLKLQSQRYEQSLKAQNELMETHNSSFSQISNKLEKEKKTWQWPQTLLNTKTQKFCADTSSTDVRRDKHNNNQDKLGLSCAKLRANLACLGLVRDRFA